MSCPVSHRIFSAKDAGSSSICSMVSKDARSNLGCLYRFISSGRSMYSLK